MVKDGKVKEALAEDKVSVPSDGAAEKAACTPVPVNKDKFNAKAVIPYGCSVEHIYQAMNEFVSFLGKMSKQ